MYFVISLIAFDTLQSINCMVPRFLQLSKLNKFLQRCSTTAENSKISLFHILLLQYDTRNLK